MWLYVHIVSTCPPLNAPDNGIMTCVLGDDDVATHMDYCTFTCKNGYRMSGSYTRKCLTSYGNAKWTGYAARCYGMLKMIKLFCYALTLLNTDCFMFICMYHCVRLKFTVLLLFFMYS